jgi:hypothetical protein
MSTAQITNIEIQEIINTLPLPAGLAHPEEHREHFREVLYANLENENVPRTEAAIRLVASEFLAGFTSTSRAGKKRILEPLKAPPVDESFLPQLKKAIHLTPAQIRTIVERIPAPPGIGVTNRKIAQNEIRQLASEYIEQIKLAPIQECIDGFTEELIESYFASLVETGDPVGIKSAEALGGPLTQMTLNLFHFAGIQSGVANAFNQVRDFLTGSAINRNPTMRLFLKAPTTIKHGLHNVFHVGDPDMIYNMRAEFEGITVKDLAYDTTTLSTEEANAIGIQDMIALQAVLRPQKFVSWQTRFRLSKVLQIPVNKYQMYTHRITMYDIANAIEGPAPKESILCVWKSQNDGNIYAIFDETISHDIQAYTNESLLQILIDREIKPRFAEWTVKGIPGIKSIEAKNVNVMGVVNKITRIDDSHIDLRISQRRTRFDGASLYDVWRLVASAKFEVVALNQSERDPTLRVKWPVGHESFLDELNMRIVADPQLKKFVSFSYMLTRGSNFKSIIWRDDIDLTRSHPVSAHEVFEYYGISAATTFLIEEFRRTLEQFSSYINPAHITLTFHMLTNLGIVNSLTFAGLNRKALGPTVAASHERSASVFLNASVFGTEERTIGVSANLYTGSESMLSGTGSVGIIAEPQDKPTLPDSDQVITGDVIVEGITFEGSQLDELLQMAELETEIAQKEQAVKLKLPERSTILDKPVVTPDVIVVQDAKASKTLLNAINKVTKGSGIIAESDEQALKPSAPTQATVVLDLKDIDFSKGPLQYIAMLPQFVSKPPEPEKKPGVVQNVPDRKAGRDKKRPNVVSNKILQLSIPEVNAPPRVGIPPLPTIHAAVVKTPEVKPIIKSTIATPEQVDALIAKLFADIPTKDEYRKRMELKPKVEPLDFNAIRMGFARLQQSRPTK